MGSAAVELLFQATVFTTANTTPSGRGNTADVRITFQTQLLPLSCLNRRPATMPPNTPHTA